MTIELAAEYATAADLVRGATLIRETAAEVVETYTPHHIEELAVPSRKTPVAVLAFLAGIGGAVAAYAGQWLIDAYLYPLDAGGRPPHMPLAFVPISIEMGFLAAALTAALLWFLGARLGNLWAPIDEVPGWSSSGYWVRARATDEADLRAVLEKTGAVRIERMPGGPR